MARFNRNGSAHILHEFDGGWATDFGSYYDSGPDNTVKIPFLLEAQNVIYRLSGGPQKAPGTTKLNSAALASGAEIMGLKDVWFSGTGGSSTQHRVLHVGTVVMKDDADGSFANINTGMEDAKIPNYCVYGDLLIYTSNGNTDVPQSWDGTTNQNLAGTPPNFAFSVVHKGRVWASGVAANPSRVYYSALNNAEDWVGAGSGEINIDSDDGDRVTGLISHKDSLFIFKGPNKGSIHRIFGSAPTGSDPFRRVPFSEEIGCVWQNSLFRFRDDVGFLWSDGNVYSLTAVDQFGDFESASLTRPIRSWLDDHLNFSRLQYAWAATLDTHGAVLFTVATDTQTNNNIMLMMDYRFQPVRWSRWDAFSGGCVAHIVDPTDSNRHTIMSGGNDGFVRKHYQETRTVDTTTAINYRVKTPFTDYGVPFNTKILENAGTLIRPKGGFNLTFGWDRDSGPSQTHPISQSGGAQLGSFVMGTSRLGGTTSKWRFVELDEGGEFRLISFTVSDAQVGVDVELERIAATVSLGGVATEDL